MHCGDDDISPPYVVSYLSSGPYGSSLASSASSSSASVWSDASSQSSEDFSVTSACLSSESENSDSELSDSRKIYQAGLQACKENSCVPPVTWQGTSTANVAPAQRQHPRRTSSACSSNLARSGCPPGLIRQSDRTVNFVDSLVDSSTQIVEAIWPLSSVSCRTEVGAKGVLPLRTFIQETLRRSRTSYSTLQVALYYLILVKPHVPKNDFTMEQAEDSHSFRALQCGRRMFLSALILASKYLQDRNYSTRAWSKISGLNTVEINQNEIAFLLAVNWRLHITEELFQKWASIVLKHTPSSPPSPGASSCSLQHELQTAEWKSIILRLTPELDNVPIVSTTASAKATIRTSASLSADVCPLAATVFPSRLCPLKSGSNESTPTLAHQTPRFMEPSPSMVCSPNKAAPAYGLLPTPRLTPRSVGFNTPAASTTTHVKPSMAFAMSKACSSQFTDKWVTSSPTTFTPVRRSSLATSSSSSSSPESMVSDHSSSSRSSRSSSISSASSAVCAPLSKLDVLARCRSAQQYGEMKLRPTFSAMSENTFDNGTTASPEPYHYLVVKDVMDVDEGSGLQTPTASYPTADHCKVVDAARTLQELQNGTFDGFTSNPSLYRGSKRSRPLSVEQNSVMQGNVRDLLRAGSCGWSENMVRPALSSRTNTASLFDGRKRVCY